jgi:hypothetical protein
MSHRISDHECLAALIRVASQYNRAGRPMSIIIPWDQSDLSLSFLGTVDDTTRPVTTAKRAEWNRDSLVSYAERLGVHVAQYGEQADRDRLGLEVVARVYGGGVRPFIMRAHCTGHETPRFWPSAGMGPAGRQRQTFLDICHAVGNPTQ